VLEGCRLVALVVC